MSTPPARDRIKIRPVNPPPLIRDAVRADLERIFAIYNEQVRDGIATFETEPRDPVRDHAWLSERDPIHPVLVAERDGEVIGWASLGPWSQRQAYRRTAEDSVYVDRSARGSGVGEALLRELIARSRDSEVKVVIARIADAAPASVRLHAKLGFTRIGTQRRAGEKLGRVLDVELMELLLDD